MRLIEEKWDEDTVMLYKFLVYTGCRLIHAVRALSEFDKRSLETIGNVAVYPMTHTNVGGEKKSFVALMPSEFGEEIKILREKVQL